MNSLSLEKRVAIIRSLVEGNSVRSVAGMTGTTTTTVRKLLVELGELCSVYQDQVLRSLTTKVIKADEIWSFVGAGAKNSTRDGLSDIWTYTAMDVDSNLVVSWLVGTRNNAVTKEFIRDVAERLANRTQLTPDGLGWYNAAVEGAFRWNGVDFTQVIKTYGSPTDADFQGSYYPAECAVAQRFRVNGGPDLTKLPASYIERGNLSVPTGFRRFTWLANGRYNKLKNHAHALSLYFMHYNFCRTHETLTKAARGIKTTPAMLAGVTDRVWTIEEVIGLMDRKLLI